MTVYLSGPMRGYPYFNFPKFDAAAKDLRTLGVVVMNPADHDRSIYPNIEDWPGFETGDPKKCPDFNLPNSLQWDFAAILDADAIVMLEGWNWSAGAKAERFVAESIGTPVMLYRGNAKWFSLRLDPKARMTGPNVR